MDLGLSVAVSSWVIYVATAYMLENIACETWPNLLTSCRCCCWSGVSPLCSERKLGTIFRTCKITKILLYFE